MRNSLKLIPKYLAFGGLVAAGLTGLLAVHLSQTDTYAISDAVTRQVNASQVLDLSILGPASWTRVCIFSPYTPAYAIEKELGFKLRPKLFADPDVAESENLLVFVHGTKVDTIVEHSTSKGYFSIKGSRCFERHQAKFIKRVGADKRIHLDSNSEKKLN